MKFDLQEKVFNWLQKNEPATTEDAAKGLKLTTKQVSNALTNLRVLRNAVMKNDAFPPQWRTSVDTFPLSPKAKGKTRKAQGNSLSKAKGDKEDDEVTLEQVEATAMQLIRELRNLRGRVFTSEEKEEAEENRVFKKQATKWVDKLKQ